MSDKIKKIHVEIDATSYEVIKEISEYYNYTDKEILDYVMNNALKEYVRGYHDMKNGYMEMATLNLEISNEFAVSENEALDYID